MKKGFFFELLLLNNFVSYFSLLNKEQFENSINNTNIVEEKTTNEVELKLKGNLYWIYFLCIFLTSFIFSLLFILWDIIMKKPAREQNEEIEAINDNEDEFTKKECLCQSCCKYISEDIMYGITAVGRLIMTWYSFHPLFFLYNFIINFICLLPSMLFFTENILMIGFIFICYIFFSFFCSNILIIPTYELFLFSFIKHKNVLAHLESLKITMNIIHNDNIGRNKIEYKKSYLVVDIILIILEILYVLGFLLGIIYPETVAFKDFTRIFVYILIYFYYLSIFFGYLIVSIYYKIKLIIYIKRESGWKDCITKSLIKPNEIINSFFNNRPPLPKNNLLCYVVNPLLERSYEEIPNEPGQQNVNEDCFNCIKNFIFQKILSCDCISAEWFHKFKNLTKIITFIIAIILGIIITASQNSVSGWYIAGLIILIIILFVCFYFLSSMLNFPYIIRNKKVFFLFSTKYKFKNEYNLQHPMIVSIIRIVIFVIMLLVTIVLFIAYLYGDEQNNLETIKNLEFNPIPDIQDKSKLKPSICISSINNMFINSYLPFINDAYYYDDNPTISPDFYSSFHIKGYKEMFFNDTLYDIKPIGNLIKSNDVNKVKMIQYDVIIKEVEQDGTINIDNEMTILAIKGTTNKKDIFLDLQLYLPSVLLTVLSHFSLFAQQKETWSFHFLEYSLSIPYRLFGQYLIIDGYLRDLIVAYNSNKSNFKKNVVIVGHSLGGGLSKILGRFLGKQAISLSGPGVNAFHSLWEYEGSSDDFEISAIDLVPDMDLVPRVEISGGTIYRIICKEGPKNCHGKELSLCEVLIMCRNPNYLQYCTKMAEIDQDQIKAIEESSEL